MVHTGLVNVLPGGSSGVAPPVSIPNTVVKRPSADDTALETEWENRSPPGGILETHAGESRKASERLGFETGSDKHLRSRKALANFR